jgi:hypothetical protein
MILCKLRVNPTNFLPTFGSVHEAQREATRSRAPVTPIRRPQRRLTPVFAVATHKAQDRSASTIRIRSTYSCCHVEACGKTLDGTERNVTKAVEYPAVRRRLRSCSKSVKYGTKQFVNQTFYARANDRRPARHCQCRLIDGPPVGVAALEKAQGRDAPPRPAHRSRRATYLRGGGHRQLPLLGSLPRVCCCRATAADSCLTSSSLIRAVGRGRRRVRAAASPFRAIGSIFPHPFWEHCLAPSCKDKAPVGCLQR